RTVALRAFARLANKQRLEAPELEPLVSKHALHIVIARKHARLVAIVPEDGFGAALPCYRTQHGERRTAAHDEARAELFERSGKTAQRFVEPPARRCARRPRLLFVR